MGWVKSAGCDSVWLRSQPADTMGWTELARARHERGIRARPRHPGDVTAEEWAIVEPLLPGRNRLGRPRRVELRRVELRRVELRRVRHAIRYIAAAGCAWSLLPRAFPPVSTVRYNVCRWRDSGLLSEVNRGPVAQVRHAVGRDAQPTAGVIDSETCEDL